MLITYEAIDETYGQTIAQKAMRDAAQQVIADKVSTEIDAKRVL